MRTFTPFRSLSNGLGGKGYLPSYNGSLVTLDATTASAALPMLTQNGITARVVNVMVPVGSAILVSTSPITAPTTTFANSPAELISGPTVFDFGPNATPPSNLYFYNCAATPTTLKVGFYAS